MTACAAHDFSPSMDKETSGRHTLHPSPIPGLAATRCVFDLIEKTTPALIVTRKPFVNRSVVRFREGMRRARVLTASDPTTLEVISRDCDEDFEVEDRMASLDTRQAMDNFDCFLASSSQDKASHIWSPDAATLSAAAMAEAAQPGGMGVGPRLTLDEAYSTFRILNLSERGITTIDPPFEHFKNLTDLDLGRNRLKCLGNLPAGLVFLSCAANDLHGRALEVVEALPSLNSLDLSYNSLEVESLLMGSESSRPRPPECSADRRIRNWSRASPRGGLSSVSLLHKKFPALQHLDLSWNHLCDLDGIFTPLRSIVETLRHLFLAGNPVSLLPLYRQRTLILCGPGLQILDDSPVTQEELSSAKEERDATEKRFWNTFATTRATAMRETGVAGGGSFLRCLDMVHVGVKLTRLSNLPGLEPAGYFEVNAKGESGAAAGIDNDQERPFQYRGEVEFLIPGYKGDPAAITAGTFEWASDVARQTTTQEDVGVDQENGRRDISTPATNPPNNRRGTAEPTDAEHDKNCRDWWKITYASVYPSKDMRDRVHFVGLEVSLFVLCGGGEQNEVVLDDEQNRDHPAGERDFPPVASPPCEEAERPSAEHHQPILPPAKNSLGTSVPLEPNRGDAIIKGSGDKKRRISADPTPGAIGGNREGSLGAEKHHRRLVGRGNIALSPFLDPEWMLKQREQHHAKNEGPVNASSTSCRVPDGRDCHGTVIHGSCELALEEWTMNTIRRSEGSGGGDCAT
ncbi:unnamed protein product, partial [Ascophyllum nodosum]